MSDESFEKRIQPIIWERIQRSSRAKRELKAWMDPMAIPFVAVAGLSLFLAWPLGIVLMTVFIGTQAAIAFLDIYPYTIFTRREVVLAVGFLAIPIALLFARLGEVVDLLCTLWLTGWVVLIAVQIHQAILRRRRG